MGLGSAGETRTPDMVVNSHPLYQLSYCGKWSLKLGGRTHGVNPHWPFSLACNHRDPGRVSRENLCQGTTHERELPEYRY